ncbi:alpha/beta hydrolase [Roseibium hamelinense]|uniref:alpha/beta hydrolase n=1 Tax=Roseibium hamelinense TaxID=150831 RepID=UPI00119FEBF9|nr:alpha/beta hydrolase [Roseibium hamelinense]MTI43729.1 alpha/beta hydrolase [Roseibium hamelinense]
MTLSNDRRLTWSEWGQAGAMPILFVTGAGMDGSLGFGEEVLDDLGLRLIAPDRPGLGGSDKDPAKTLTSVAEDFAGLAAQLETGPMPIVAFSQGAPFALAMAARGGFGPVALVSGQDDLGHQAFSGQLPPEVAHMVHQAATDPNGFLEMMTRIAEPGGLFDLILSMSSAADKARYGSEPFASAYRRALQGGFRQGPEGYARDTLAAFGAWPFDLEEISGRVALWYGAQDKSPVHSPDFGKTLSCRLPNAVRHVLSREGGALLWTRARDILSDLKAATQAVSGSEPNG